LVECAYSGFDTPPAFSHYPWLLVAKFGMHCPVFLFIHDLALMRVAHYSYPSTFACSRKSWVRLSTSYKKRRRRRRRREDGAIIEDFLKFS
jgi:hypothetical protein